MEEVRVELAPNGKATLVALPGLIAIEAPTSPDGRWSIPVERLAALVWRSPFGAEFAAHGLTGSATDDVAPAMVGNHGTKVDVWMSFTEPLQIPFQRGRALWGRSVVMWRSPRRDPRALWPPAAVRSGRATSLELRAATHPKAVKAAMAHSGIDLPEFSSGP